MNDLDRPGDSPADAETMAGDATPTLSSHGKPPHHDSIRALPEHIGEYRILGILGQGGMGVVYEAEQPSPRRLVALKVVRGTEIVDDLRLKMFEREASTLARLDHPNIGKIYQSGRTPEGRHYFAMELVRGPSLGEWLTSRPANPDRTEIELRLRLFRQICDAVHYAHQRGVIHRDLKPSNLIVTDAPASATGSSPLNAMVRILDFGLARITEEDIGASQVTETGDIKGTLPYMAPEQARGESGAIDVRTDVYALGVILYEMLTRQRPYAVDATSLLSAVRVICEQAPRPLAEVWQSSLRLDPDLTTIVGAALEKEPDRRYASAAAFSDDVERFLTSQPIQARPASTMYQIKKLVARRKPLFATAAVALLLLVVAAIGLGVLYVRSVESERLARLEAATATRTSEFLVNLFEQANPEKTRGATLTARQVVDVGARQVRDELASEPAMQARMMGALGRVYLSLGIPDSALSMTDASVALRRKHLRAGDAEIAQGVAQQARVFEELGMVKESRAAYAEAVERYEALGASGTDGLIATLGNSSSALDDAGEYGEANRGLDRALSLLSQRRPPDEERLLNLLIGQANIRLHTRQTDSALTILDRALTLTRRLHGENHHLTGNVLTALFSANSQAKHLDRAREFAFAALKVHRAIYGEDHPKVARDLGNVAISFAEDAKGDEARPYFEQSIEVLIRVYGPNHPEVAQGWMNLGLLELQSGHVPRALELLQRSVSIHERVSASSPSLALSLYHLAAARSALGQHDQALRALLRVLAMDEKMHGPESADVSDDLEAVASVQRDLGLTAEATRNETRMNAIRAKLTKAGAGP
ncbi:MAG: tetratricopeptide repeat protein [Candidatus Eisenbacteria bacterium]|uniref:Tetratricopeptide repeat protein n=1 Tax=Eiseniibacteriota bacterium TaxID=2212470 RepID=A0A849SI47_UNCEI|nr:tetratricopeptide repeat protein [Candidatus Eisenbacteria bacterium]